MLYFFDRLVFTYGVKFVRLVNLTIIIYFFALNGTYLLQLIFSRYGLIGHMRRLFFADYETISTSSYTLPVSVIVPAFNESATILDAVESLRELDYPEAEIIIVNDGSTDDTLKLLKHTFDLQPVDRIVRKIRLGESLKLATEPIIGVYHIQSEIGLQRLVVVDKIRGGKADALNAGILVSRYPYICSVDADSMLESDSLLKVMKPVIEDPDRVVASGGVVRVANGCTVVRGRVKEIALPKNTLAMLQTVEYLRAFLGSRFALGQAGALLIISGVFAVLKKELCVAVGGYERQSIVEDMELVVRIQRYLRQREIGYRVVFVPDPIAWTEVPTTLRMLARQRIRWHSGLIEVMLKNRDLLFNYHYGALGLEAMPYYFFFEMLGPVIELFGYVAVPLAYFFGMLSWPEVALFIIAAFLFGSFMSVFAILLAEEGRRRYKGSRELLRLVWYGVLDNVLYRPLISVLRFIATIRYIRGQREWGVQEHRGFTEQERAA